MVLGKISVIVPVYKAEKYVAGCIESILGQTHRDWELILVDDGSPDQAAAICEGYAAKDARIVVIRKENGGAASARNVGLQMATGDYVMFCDADDTMPANTLEELHKPLCDDDVQLTMGDFEYILIDSAKGFIQHRHSINREKRILELKNSAELLDFWKANNMTSACGKLYRMDVIKTYDLSFHTDLVVFEDFSFVIDYLRFCRSICMIPHIVYQYYSWSDSPPSARRSRSDFYDDVVFASNQLTAYLTELHCDNIDAFQEESIYVMLRYAMQLLWETPSQNRKERSQKHKRIKQALKEEIYQNMIEHDRSQLRPVEVFFYKRKSVHGILAYRLFRRLL